MSAPREGLAVPRDAATLLAVRDAVGGGIKVFCVERHLAGFLGGAVVFPGGKLDASDLDAAWEAHVSPVRAPDTPIAGDEFTLRGLAIAACREALEEAAILPVVGTAPTHAELLEWRTQLERAVSPGIVLRQLLAAHGLRLDLSSLHPFARWITPVSESRRFDTRFFLFVAGDAVTGAHDDRETTASFWATPAEVLARFDAGALTLVPPTHRTLEILATARDATDAVTLAGRACLEPICPELVRHADAHGETMALALPGDPAHSVRDRRTPGRSRYVLRGGRFVAGDAPAGSAA